LKSLRISIERHHASAFCTRVTFRDCRTLRPPSAEADKRRSGRPSPSAGKLRFRLVSGQSRRGSGDHARQPLLRHFRPLPADSQPQRGAHASRRTYEAHVTSRSCLGLRLTLPNTTFFVSHSAR
jgi:hypothetical protein